jgi:hypothetical protein
MQEVSRWDLHFVNFFESFMEDGDQWGHTASGQGARNARADGEDMSRLFTDRVETRGCRPTSSADDIEAQIKARLGLVLRAPEGREKKGGVYCPTQMAEVGL